MTQRKRAERPPPPSPTPAPVELQPRRAPGPMSELSRELLDMERRGREMQAAQAAAMVPTTAPPTKARP